MSVRPPVPILIFCSMVLWIVTRADAQTNLSLSPDNPPVPAARVDHVTCHSRIVESDILGETRLFRVHLPVGYEETHDRYGVLVVLDGGAYSGYAAETAQLLALQGDIPQLLIVGLPNIDRTRDFTPYPVAQSPTAGGGKKFLRFLTEELLPQVDREYRTLPFHILYGHSLGGNFVAHTLLTKPDAFEAGLAISPALDNDDGLTLDDLRRTLQNHRAGQRRFLYMAIANEYGYEPALDLLSQMLEQKPPTGLRWEAHKYPDDTHSSIVPRTMDLSLRALYHKWPLTRQAMLDGLPGVEAHYTALSEDLGYEVVIPENVINVLGYRALADVDFTTATQLFRRNVTNFPNSANVYDSLAEAYYRQGIVELAIVNYNKSLELNPDNENAKQMLEVIRAEKAAQGINGLNRSR